MGIGPPELIIIALIVVILFGGRKLPELGSGIGKALANFKKGYKEAEAIDITPQTPPEKSQTAASSRPKDGESKDES